MSSDQSTTIPAVHTDTEQTVKRRKELTDAFQAAGLQLRHDSKLCQRYIDGLEIKPHGNVTEWTVSAIVRRMSELKYLYKYCYMKQRLDEEHDYLRANPDKYQENLENIKNADHPVETIFDRVEKTILDELGGYPPTWPWLHPRPTFAPVHAPSATSQTTPAPTETTPAPIETTQATSETTPAPIETTQATSETTPATSETTPAPTETTPATSETTPATSETTPATTETTPATTETTLATTETTPATSETTPLL